MQALTDGRSSGQTVSVSTALGLAPFYRGVKLLSESVGMLPCKVYVKTAAGREEAPATSRPSELLHTRPNDDMAADEFWALVQSHLDTWGNAFLWKQRAGDGRIGNLWPVHPSRVAVSRLADGTRRFVIDGKVGEPHTISEILHIRGLGSDGLVGYSPVQVARQQLGAALAAQDFEGRFWENDATPGVTLMHPGKLTPEAVDRVRAKWEEHHKGSRNRRKTAVLAENMTIQQMTMPLRDAQFIQGKRQSATEQALILGIPPYMVGGETGGSMTYSTVEGQSLDFLKWSLAPRLVRLQNAVTADRDLMPPGWHAEFQTAAVLRATAKERAEHYAIALNPETGWMRRDEVRELENLPAESAPENDEEGDDER